MCPTLLEVRKYFSGLQYVVDLGHPRPLKLVTPSMSYQADILLGTRNGGVLEVRAIVPIGIEEVVAQADGSLRDYCIDPVVDAVAEKVRGRYNVNRGFVVSGTGKSRTLCTTYERTISTAEDARTTRDAAAEFFEFLNGRAYQDLMEGFIRNIREVQNNPKRMELFIQLKIAKALRLLESHHLVTTANSL